MSWNSKRDGYPSSNRNKNDLGKPVERLTPNAGTTHVITIPGTTFKMFFSEKFTATNKVDSMLKYLAKTTVPGPFKRRIKATPVLMTIAEFQALTTVKAA